MAKLSTDDLLEAFKEMTLIELSEFVSQFEDTFGVTAAAPVAVAAAPAAGGGAAEAAVEQDEFDELLRRLLTTNATVDPAAVAAPAGAGGVRRGVPISAYPRADARGVLPCVHAE